MVANKQQDRDMAQALLDFGCCVFLPEFCLFKHGSPGLLGTVERTIQVAEKPVQPLGNVKIVFLRRLKQSEASLPLQPDLRGQHCTWNHDTRPPNGPLG
ncbi:hypothetical protein [Mesorhizobium sp. M0037]|uniref:hypothetical protein n=1 Tax=unclassified Mesorhizobium TaxID=325217 RepID=UPI0033355B24